MNIDLDYFKKIQGNYGTASKKEAQINKIKQQETKHFHDTHGTEQCFVNGMEQDLIVIKQSDYDKKKIISKPNESFCLGDVIDCYDVKWLITEIDECNNIHCVGKMTKCNFICHWQNSSGEIVERYGVLQDKTSYSSGETEGKVIITPNSQKHIQFQLDNETLLLPLGKRLMGYSKNRDKTKLLYDNNIDVPVYKITRREEVTNTFNDRGIIEITYSQVEYDKDTDVIYDDKYNGKYDLICNKRYTESTTSTEPDTPINTLQYFCDITYKTDPLLRVSSKKKFTASVYKMVKEETNPLADENGYVRYDVALTGLNIVWTLQGDVANKITMIMASDKSYITLQTDDDTLIGSKFDATLRVDGNDGEIYFSFVEDIQEIEITSFI